MFRAALLVCAFSCQVFAWGAKYHRTAAERTVVEVYEFASQGQSDLYRSKLTSSAYQGFGADAGMITLANEKSQFGELGVKQGNPQDTSKAEFKLFRVQVAGKNTGSWKSIRIVDVQCLFEGYREIPCLCGSPSDFLCGAICGREPIYSNCLLTKFE